MFANGTSSDVTSSTFFTLSDPSVGTLSNNTFTWGGDHGGAITITAVECGVTATTTLTLTMSASVGAGSVNGTTASNQFGNAGNSTNASCTGANAPQILYPTDNTLVPPNTNVIEVHFAVGSSSNQLFEISFENSVTDVKVYTACNSSDPVNGPAQGLAVAATASNPQGCIFELDQDEWNYIAHTNRNGDPVTIKVRALGCDGFPPSAANAVSSTTRQISFAEDDLVGALYYWASINLQVSTQGGLFSGGVFSYDFGVRNQKATPVLTPTTNGNGTCIGCHVVSRDGRKMIFNYDDNDADDEYSDVKSDVFDIPSATYPGVLDPHGNTNVYFPGYGTWNHETTQFLISDGLDTATPKGAFTLNKASGAAIGTTQPTPATANMRATSPDWAPDDSQVVFSYVPTGPNTIPNLNKAPYGPGFYLQSYDEWFAGASLYVAPWNATTNSLGAPTLLLASQASTPPGQTANSGVTNYYYPSFSPDNSFIAFNYAPYGPNFHNPTARVQLIVNGQASPAPDDLLNLNTATTNNYTNSWPRWSPFVQQYKGGHILWMTFSSTRPYGLWITNSGTHNCYPTENPNQTAYPFFENGNTPTAGCSRTQLWMAAINLDTGAVKSGTDVSHPAFWLPFQDRSTNNHLAQWTQQQFSGTCKVDGDCNSAGSSGRCCFSGACAACLPPPPPPPATCGQSANCSPGMCCLSGSCGQCPMDGGTGGGMMSGCNTCLDCSGQACNGGVCGSCKTSADCCAGLNCNVQTGQCVAPIS
jgi:hypothetical protein